VVGTFRITQPGSSVATSLTGGEAVRKNVGLLEIKGNQFRLLPIPLTQVRSFVMGELTLRDQSRRLDPEDPKVDAKVTNILEEEVRTLKAEAQEKYQNLLRDAAASGKAADVKELTYKLEKPDEVLVRLKVEHSGFSTLNNQRFGAKFVGEVANPVRIILDQSCCLVRRILCTYFCRMFRCSRMCSCFTGKRRRMERRVQKRTRISLRRLLPRSWKK